MRFRAFFPTLAPCALLAATAFAQGNPTGTLSGRVTDPDGLALPGVTVTASSPALQGKRSAVTPTTGDYIIPFLPPGEYTLAFELSGFQPLEKRRRLAVAETASLDVRLSLAGVTETVTILAEAPSDFGQSATVATSYKAAAIDKLPVGRDLEAAVLLAPGTAATGPSGNISISGAMSFEGLYLLNGVVLNETLRGQPRPLFIEDAIEETKVSVGNVSAEYGRFGGGVVNTITKSGGNEFSGSFRTTFNKEKWRGLTPFEKETLAEDPRSDELVPAFEATFGGPIFKDKLWFFGAGRSQETPEAETLAFTNIPYGYREEERRYEGKLTWSVTPKHTFKGAYTKIHATQRNRSFGTVMDRASLYDRQTPEDLISLNYTGILSPKFFVEGQYSRREFTFVGSGSRFTDLVRGTLILDRSRSSARWNSPTFCAVCNAPPGKLNEEERDNQNFIVKASYFLSTGSLGSHNIVSGFDAYDDQRRNDNWQSGSGYRVSATNTIIRAEQLFPVFTPNTTFITWNPIFETSKGSRWRTYSAFLNDTWRLGSRWSFNVGARWDKNDGRDQSGNTVIRDSAFSPRLGVTFDPKGDGAFTVNAGFARYVAAVASGIGDTGSAGGRQASFGYTYLGPAINADLNTPNPVPVDQALTTLFNWFFASGGTNRPLRGTPTIPGVNRKVGHLISPGNYAYSLGFTRKLGTKGLVRLDGLWREFRDFYADGVDTTTGKVADSQGRRYDLRVVTNTNDVKRSYKALIGQVSYRLGERLHFNGNYTLSNARGNINGEDTGSGPVTDQSALFYPEYSQQLWRGPIGDLSNDQRHKARMWVNYDVPVSSKMGRLDVAVLQRIESAQAYSSDGVIDSKPYVTNPGYLTPPATVPYYFGGRGNFMTETMTATDLSVNYAYRIGGLGKKTELFFRFVVLNLFNQSAQVDSGDETVFTNSNNTRYARFNPFTETPVRGVHWDLGPQFGKAIEAEDYQTPRTYSFAVGFRF